MYLVSSQTHTKNLERFLIKVRFSYKEIAQEVFGKTVGGNIVLGAQLIELLMTCILYVVLCGDLLMGAFNRGVVDTRSYMMAAGLLLLPCAFLKNLQVKHDFNQWSLPDRSAS